ncbi:Proteasome activator complex subunit 4 Proteasome activator PA200 [Channa argus]|uniref:Proteasome activator complex subunit 4 Proteasome activator PA200 n=1 Tax=Channa argus TaxID=215402 RepID=A0A6G1QPQ1_CHAAH|nr:Proteasome activator complex subunit 4 Proteasome activator PA200 [Channa argus]
MLEKRHSCRKVRGKQVFYILDRGQSSDGQVALTFAVGLDLSQKVIRPLLSGLQNLDKSLIVDQCPDLYRHDGHGPAPHQAPPPPPTVGEFVTRVLHIPSHRSRRSSTTSWFFYNLFTRLCVPAEMLHIHKLVMQLLLDERLEVMYAQKGASAVLKQPSPFCEGHGRHHPQWFTAVPVLPSGSPQTQLQTLSQTHLPKAKMNVNKTLSENRHQHQQCFTDDQLLVLTDLLVSPCYYA